MRHLNVQLQPERSPALDMARTRQLLEALAKDQAVVAGFETVEGEDEGPYVNFTFAAKDPAGLWAQIQREVLGDRDLGAEIAASSIIIVEGDEGWDNYLLLHHFDPQHKTDSADKL